LVPYGGDFKSYERTPLGLKSHGYLSAAQLQLVVDLPARQQQEANCMLALHPDLGLVIGVDTHKGLIGNLGG
jgi:hypothetical protein